MTTPSGTPDWTKPLPGGARTLINDVVSISTGSYVSAWVDVTSFSGLWLKSNGVDGNAAHFGTIEVQFDSAAHDLRLPPKVTMVYRGDLAMEVNVPVLGAQARVVITGPAAVATSFLSVVGHGVGGSSGVRAPSRQLAGIFGTSIAAAGTLTVTPSTVTEGPAHLTLVTAGQPGQAQVVAFDSSGASQMLGQIALAANQAATLALWLPPQPVQVNFSNNGAAAQGFYGGLFLGRS